MTWRPFEIDDDGYPTEEFIDRLTRHNFEVGEAARFMVEEFPGMCEQIPCCSCEVVDGEPRFAGEPVKLVHFSTGGWSGAEDLLGTMLRHFWISQLQLQWRRGGHYIFEVPAHRLAIADAAL